MVDDSRRRRLAPWAEAAYFDAPRATVVTVHPGDIVQVAPANVNRVALFISANPAAFAQVGEDNLPSTVGLPVSTALPPLVITEAKHGNLCQSAWYGGTMNAGPVSFYVVEVILREWPGSV